jgi:hypothetical protein
MIRFPCTCGRQLQARDGDAGRDAVCPVCGRPQVVPVETVLVQTGKASANARRSADAWKASPAGRSGLPDARRSSSPADLPTSSAARRSFVLGLSSLVFNLFTGIPAVVLGLLALARIRRSWPPLGGARLAGWGIVLGLLGIFVVTPLMIGFTWTVLTTVPEDAEPGPSSLPPRGPAIDDAEEANREASLDNLENLAGALWDYQRQHQHFPPAAFSEPAGKPLLSWRVALLPYLNNPEAAELYREFKLHESWDGPHNQRLLPRMPKVFALPGRAAPAGRTYYRVVTGPHTAFEDPRGQRVEDFTDALEDTLFIVEATAAVPWTQPDELSWTPNGPLPRFGTHYNGGFHAAFGDGSAGFVPPWIDSRTLRGMITRNGGEHVQRP